MLTGASSVVGPKASDPDSDTISVAAGPFSAGTTEYTCHPGSTAALTCTVTASPGWAGLGLTEAVKWTGSGVPACAPTISKSSAKHKRTGEKYFI